MSDRPADFALEAVAFDELPGWKDDNPSSLFTAMEDCYRHITEVKPYRTGSTGLGSDDLLPLLAAVRGFAPSTAAEARSFFENMCQPVKVRELAGQRGFVTAFYEPEVEVSDSLDAVFRYPFYRRPDDLIDLDDNNRPADLDPSYAFGRMVENEIKPYADRAAIDSGFLAGQGLEIAWAKSKVDVFFAHVQGACRLVYPDGRVKRITYAAKAGHPFSAIGKRLIELGEIETKAISMQSIRQWLNEHPDRVDEILWHNRSYIFFRETDSPSLSKGPIAAAKVPLVAGRSLAVDRSIHSFGFPFFISAETLKHLDQGQPFQHLMLALDTGSAIVGPQRGDIFTGSGFTAGELAGTVRHPADFYILVPKQAVARLLS
ncbi:murein transglycosylase A [Oryzifoliimicrobium ureilyticus]|uniref:murein transglycosylase A n=1 Tax=Oryzifoliimicrobium ureilyticus TaxID=3113724 RepID=UPI00307668A3